MQPIEIPEDAVKAYNGEQVIVSGPGETEQLIEPCPAIRVEDNISGYGFKILIGLDDRDVEIITKTKTIWLNFHSRMFPIFSIRPADVYLENPTESEDRRLPVKVLQEDFFTEARNVWPGLDINGVLRGIFWTEPDQDLLFPSGSNLPVYTNDVLIHNTMNGQFWTLSPTLFDNVQWFDPTGIKYGFAEESDPIRPVESESNNDETMQQMFPKEKPFEF